MMSRVSYRYLLFFVLSILTACTQCHDSKQIQVEEEARGPDRVEVQHILIGFKGSLPGKEVERSKSEAKTLANEIFQKLKQNPESMSELVQSYSDDRVPGIYKLTNYGVEKNEDEFQRSLMSEAFGDLAFELKIGEFGLVEFEPESSPYGFHIIRRLQ